MRANKVAPAWCAVLMLLAAWLAPTAGATSVPLTGVDTLISWDRDALRGAGLESVAMDGALHHVDAVPGRVQEAASFAAAGGSLQLLRDGLVIHGLGAGAIRHRGGPVLAHAGGEIDLRGFRIQVDPEAPLALLLVDASGTVWFSADHAHYGYAQDDSQILQLRHMNLRISAHLATVLGDAALFGEPVGALDFRARIDAAATAKLGTTGQCSAPWPGPGRLTDVMMIHSDLSGWHDSVHARRCSLPPLPDGGECSAGSTTGTVVITPDASLRNVGDTGIAWYSHFQGRFPPYDNDQHPILVWNLYRVDGDGAIHQIGASGAKHAFYTVNARCGCQAGHVVYPGCEDTYSLASNDNNAGPQGQVWQNLAPRSEIIPHSVQWARCGSVWDPHCRGELDPDTGAADLYEHRLLVSEAQMMSPLADGARFFLEYWYLVRDDDNIYNSMGHREIRPYKTTTAGRTTWRIEIPEADTPQRGFRAGPVINRWVEPAGSSQANVELDTDRGRVRVAVQVQRLGESRWRYRYAVMNFDYANARTDPASSEPDLRLLSSRGIAGFGVQMSESAHVEQTGIAGLDESVSWPVQRAAVELQWRSRGRADTLDWGVLSQFEFVSDAPPSAQGAVVLYDHVDDGAAQHRLRMLGPRLPSTERQRERPVRVLPWAQRR